MRTDFILGQQILMPVIGVYGSRKLFYIFYGTAQRLVVPGKVLFQTIRLHGSSVSSLNVGCVGLLITKVASVELGKWSGPMYLLLLCGLYGRLEMTIALIISNSQVAELSIKPGYW